MRKIIAILFVSFASVCLLFSQTYESAIKIIREEGVTKEMHYCKTTFFAECIDYCDYHLIFELTDGYGLPRAIRSFVVSSGKEELYESNCEYSLIFRFYRGNLHKKPKFDFAYCLPVAKNQTTSIEVLKSYGYQMSFKLPSDTIYACRDGIVCNDNLSDDTTEGYSAFNRSRWLSQITIYHDDGSFGQYTFQGEPLIYPGENIKMGMPIAVIKENLKSVMFSVYYLDESKVKNKESESKHSYLQPFFQTHHLEKTHLESNKSYICELNDEMQMQDMNKREKNKFLKNKLKR